MGSYLEHIRNKEQSTSKKKNTYGEHIAKKRVGFDTFEADLASASDLVNTIYGGWQSADTMNSAKETVSSMRDRLGAYRDYANTYKTDTDLTQFNSSMDKLIGAYDTALSDWDTLAGNYSRYKDANSYSKETAKFKELNEMSTDELLSKVKSGDEIAYTTYGGQDITWESLYNDKRRAELAASEESDVGWEKYLADVEEQKRAASAEKTPWWQTFIEGFGDTSSDSFFGTTFNNVIEEKRNDVSFARPAADWTDEEKRIFGGYYLESPALAYQYATELNNKKGAAAKNAQKQAITESATSNALSGVGHTAGAILTAPLGILDFVDDVTSLAAGRPITENGFVTPFEYSQTVTSGISSALNDKYGTLNESIPIIGGKGLGDVYGLGTSVAQSAMSAYTLGSAGTLLSYFGQGAAAGVDDALSRGASEEEAVLYGTILGAAEGVSEHIGADRLLKVSDVSSKTIKEAFKEVFKQAGAEGLEETFSSVVGQVADNFIMQDKSAFQNAVRTYITNGMSEEEATKKAWMDSVEGILYDAVSGAVSGGVHAGPHVIQTQMENAGIGKEIKSNGRTDTLAKYAAVSDDVNIQKYLQLLNEGNASNAKVGSLYKMVADETGTKMDTAYDSSKVGKITSYLMNRGMDADTAKATADLVYKEASGEYELTNRERKTISNEDAQAAIADINSKASWYNGVSQRAKTAIKNDIGLNEVFAPKSALEKRTDELRTGATETTDDETNQKITLEGIRTENGNTILKTNVGEKSVESVTLSDSDAEIVAMAETMDSDAADLFVSMYTPGTNTESYKDHFDLVYSYGANAYGTDSVLKNRGPLTPTQAVEVYRLGMKSSTAAQQAKIDEIAKNHDTGIKAGKFDDSAVNYKKLNKRQRAAVAFVKIFSEKTGVNIVLFESKADEKGHRTAENGRYEADTNTIYLDVYAGFTEHITEDAIISTLSHELTHWMQEKAPEVYAELSGIIMDALCAENNCSPEVLIMAEQKRLKDSLGKEYGADYARDELIARSCENMLTDGKTAEKYISQMDEKTAKKLGDRLKEIVEKLKAWISDLLSVYKSGSREAAILRKFDDKLTQAVEVWDKAFEQAARANQAMQKENVGVESSGDEMYSPRYAQYKTDEYYQKITPASRKEAEKLNMLDDRNIARYRLEVNGVFSGELSSGMDVIMGMPSELLIRYGVSDRLIHIPQSIVRKIAYPLGYKIGNNIINQKAEDKTEGDMGGKHNLGISAVKNLPLQIVDPIAITRNNVKNRGNKNSIVLWTNWITEDEQGVMVALVIDSVGAMGLQNNISTAFQADYEYAESFFENEEDILYTKNNKDIKQLLSVRRYVPKARVDDIFGNSITHTQKNVKRSDRDSEGNGLTKEQIEFFKDSKVRDENGNLKVMYHGTGRADRVGYLFRADRATSGPMAFFTDNKKIADNYARDKQDTSLAYDKMYRDYYTQFRIDVGGENLSISEAWDKLPTAKRVEIRRKAPHVTFDDDMENIIYDENVDSGTGGFGKYRINEHNGNYLSALIGEWLEDGNLYGQEESFLEVLSLVGLDDVKYMNPDMRDEKTYQVYLNIKKPFITTEISDEMLQAFKESAEMAVYEPGNGADTWDKRNITPAAWIERLESCIEEGTTHVWTSIPDFVTDTLKVNGYDGIFDEGGKAGGEGHTVVIPFYSNQIKDITNLNPTDNEDIRFSDRYTESIYDAVGELKRVQKENDKLRKDIERLRQKNRLERTVTGMKLPQESYITTMTHHLLNQVDSQYDRNSLKAELKEIYAYMQSEDVEWDILMSKTLDLANDLLSKSRERKVTNDYAKDILNELRKARVVFSDTQKAEAEYAYGKGWNRNYFGRITVANEGTPLDVAWQEWVNMYPDVFDAEISDADMPTALLDVYDSVRAASEVVEAYDKSEAARELAFDIYGKLWNAAPVVTLADKHDREVKRLKYEHRMEMKELRERDANELRMTKEKSKQTIRRIRQKRDEDIQYIKERSRAYTKEYKDKLDRKAEISRITKKALKLNTWLKKNSKDEHVAEILKAPVAAILKSLNFSSERLLGLRGGDHIGEPTNRDISLSKAFENLADALDNVNKAQIGEKEIEGLYGHLDMPADFVEFVQDMRKNMNDLLRSVGDNEYILNAMTLEQLKDINTMLTTLTHTVTQANKALADANGKSIAALSQDTMNRADGLGPKSKFTNRITDFFNFDNALPYHTFKMFGEGAQKVFENLQNGWDKLAFHVKEIMDYTNNAYTAKQVKAWSEEVHEIDSTTKMTTAQIMSLYCLQKREQARGHLVAGGIRVADFKEGRATVSQPNGTTLTPHEIDKIISLLTADQKEVADKLQEFMNTVCTEWGNEISMRRFGYKAFGEENYFPIRSDSNNLSQDPKNQENDLFRLLNMSFTKGTIKNANNRIVIDNIFDVFASHTSDMAKYNALALPILDAFKWYNYREKEKVNPEDKEDKRFTTRGVKQSLENAYGAGAKSYIIQFLKDLNGANSGGLSNLERFDKKLISNYKIASVGANLRVAILQPTSYVRASVVIDPKYLTAAFAHKPQIKKAKATCGIALWKSLGFFDTNINRGVTSLIKHDETVWDKIREGSMWLAEKGDELTWGYLYNACEAEVRDKHPELSGASKDEAVAKRLREVIYSTQVVDSTMTRTQTMRSSSTWNQIITSFMSEPSISYNMLHSSYMQFLEDKKKVGAARALRRNGKQITRTMTAYIITSLCASVAGGLVDIMRDDEEDVEIGEELLKSVGDNVLSDVLSMLPLMRDVVSIYKGFGATRMDMQGVTSVINASKKIMKAIDEGELNYSTVYSAVKAASQISGVAGSNFMRDVNAIWNNTVGEVYESLKIK